MGDLKKIAGSRTRRWQSVPKRYLQSLTILLLLVCGTAVAQAGSAKIAKVLPQFLDLDGRHALSPSLYERDAYQVFLRQHPEKRSALRFEINWKATGLSADKARLRVELRSGNTNDAQSVVLEQPVRATGMLGKWTSMRLAGDRYAKFGQLLAWRVTLWDGDQLQAEKRSFLW